MLCLTAMYGLACKHGHSIHTTISCSFLRIYLTSYFHFFMLVLLIYVLYKQGLINVDFEAEVEDDILSIFRKGEVKNDAMWKL